MANALFNIFIRLLLFTTALDAQVPVPIGKTITLRDAQTSQYLVTTPRAPHPLSDESSTGLTAYTHFIVEAADHGYIRLRSFTSGGYVTGEFASETDPRNENTQWLWVPSQAGDTIQLKQAFGNKSIGHGNGSTIKPKNHGIDFAWAEISDGLEEALSWRMIAKDPRFPSNDVILAICEVTDDRFNLPLAPATDDCTPAFQAAIDFAARDGGGVVFVPEGQYRLDGPLTLPKGVLLEGRWAPPTDPDYPNKLGSVIRLENHSIDIDASVIINEGGQLRNLTFWHSKQDPIEGITPYPWIMKGGSYLENITFLNAYRGFSMGASNADIRNIYGSAYAIGLSLTANYAIPRLSNHQFSSEYLRFSGLIHDPTQLQAHEDATLASGIASQAERLHATKYVFGHQTGFRRFRDAMTKQSEGLGTNAIFRNCQIGYHHDVTNAGGSVEGSLFENCAVAIQSKMPMTVSNTNMIGSTEADVKAEELPINLTIHNSYLNLSKLSLGGGQVNGEPLAEPIPEVAAVSGQTEPGGNVGDDEGDEGDPDDETGIDLSNLIVRNPLKLDIFNVKHPDFAGGAKGNGITDDSPAIRAAVNAANANGGGFVLFPSGHYRLTENLHLDKGVQLRGADSGLSSAISPLYGSSLKIDVAPVAGDEVNLEALITMGDDSGVRGLAFYYPNQSSGTAEMPFQKYPYTIRGIGVRNYVMLCRPINPYRFVHLTGDDNMIAYNQLSGIRQMVFCSNNRNGLFRDNLTKTANWAISDYPYSPDISKHGLKDNAVKEGFEILHLRNCDNYTAIKNGSFAHAGYRGATIENSSGDIGLALEQYITGFAILSGDKELLIEDKDGAKYQDGPDGADAETFGLKLFEDFTGRVFSYGGVIAGSYDALIDVRNGSLHRTGSSSKNRDYAGIHVGRNGSAFLEGFSFRNELSLRNEGSLKMRNCSFKSIPHKFAEQLGADNDFNSTFAAVRLNRRTIHAYGLTLDPAHIEFRVDGEKAQSYGARYTTNAQFDFTVEDPGFLNDSPHKVEFSLEGSIPEGTQLELWFYSTNGWTLADDWDDLKNPAFGEQGPEEDFPDLRLIVKQGESPLVKVFAISTKVHQAFGPKAPTGLVATSGSEITLDWDDNTEDDITYNVYRRAKSSGTFGVPIATGLESSDFVDGSSSGLNALSYMVTAVYSDGRESGISADVRVKDADSKQTYKAAEQYDKARAKEHMLTGFASWITEYPGMGGLAEIDDDPDGDKIPNAIEAWFGTHPGEMSQGLGNLATNTTTTTFSHPQNENPPSDLNIFYQWSTNLTDWHLCDGSSSPDGGATTVNRIDSTTHDTTTTVTFESSGLIDRLFLRVDVQQH